MIDELIKELVEKGKLNKEGNKPKIAKQYWRLKDKRRIRNGKKRVSDENEKENKN